MIIIDKLNINIKEYQINYKILLLINNNNYYYYHYYYYYYYYYSLFTIHSIHYLLFINYSLLLWLLL